MRRLTFPRLVVATVAGAFLLSLASSDLVAASIALVGAVSLVLALRAGRAKLHQHVVAWNDDPNDWTRPGTDVITRRVLDGATSRTVVLLHDGGGNRSQTVAALPAIIAGFRARGFLFTTVDGLDAAVGSPYVERRGIVAQARGLAVIAGFRLEMAVPGAMQ
jgi:peptidoglycan/xylan/chitin deacetylase (PgdA/CDA1 family)